MAEDEPRGEIDVRASDADREATMAPLRDAAGEGRLTLEELAQRIEGADGARTRGELARLEADLPAEPRRIPSTPARRRLYGILGGDTLSGPFQLSGECRVINVMGGADLDLTQAVLTEARSPSASSRSWAGRTSSCPTACMWSTRASVCSAGTRSSRRPTGSPAAGRTRGAHPLDQHPGRYRRQARDPATVALALAAPPGRTSPD